MKRKFWILLTLVAVLLGITALSSAELYLSNGSYTAYIGENDYLYLTDAVGTTKVLQVACRDLLSMTDTQLYCQTKEGKLYAIMLDGSSTSIVSATPTQDQLDAVTAKPVFTLANGSLSLTGSDNLPVVIGTNVTLAGANTTNLYYIEETNGLGQLKTVPLAMTGTLVTSTIIGPVAPGSLSLIATEDAVTIVSADRSLMIVDLSDNSFSYVPAVSQTTEKALVVGSKLFYYTLNEDGSYHMSSRADSGITELGGLPSNTPGLAVITSTPAPTATATPRPTATPTPYHSVTSAPSSDKYQTLRYGNTGSKVKRMQQKLFDLGYPVGTVDGDFGDATLLALNLFQDAIGYREHNYASSEVLEKLYSKKAPAYDPFAGLKRGESGTDVLLLQTALYTLGYDPGKLDGIYGEKTEYAVKLYQAAVGLPVTGEADKTTLIYLYGTTPTIMPTIPPTYQPQNPTPTVPFVSVVTPTPSVVTMPPISTPTDIGTTTDLNT